MKLHLCCGDVYLEGYVNIDIHGSCVMGLKGTDLANYYTKPINSNAGQRAILVDRKMDITKYWDYKSGSIDEVLIICGIEHFTKPQAEHIISEANRVLEVGGKFRFDFPDILETFKRHQDNPEYVIRLLYGSGKNLESTHKWGYTDKTILEVLSHTDWQSVTFKELVKHDYPMVGVEAIK